MIVSVELDCISSEILQIGAFYVRLVDHIDSLWSVLTPGPTNEFGELLAAEKRKMTLVGVWRRHPLPDNWAGHVGLEDDIVFDASIPPAIELVNEMRVSCIGRISPTYTTSFIGMDTLNLCFVYGIGCVSPPPPPPPPPPSPPPPLHFIFIWLHSWNCGSICCHSLPFGSQWPCNGGAFRWRWQLFPTSMESIVRCKLEFRFFF